MKVKLQCEATVFTIMLFFLTPFWSVVSTNGGVACALMAICSAITDPWEFTRGEE